MTESTDLFTVCLRVSDGPVTAKGTKNRRCIRCTARCHVAASTEEIAVVSGRTLQVLCRQCWEATGRPTGGGMVTSAKQRAEMTPDAGGTVDDFARLMGARLRDVDEDN